MKRTLCLVCFALFTGAAVAEEAVFRDVQFPTPRGKLANASLRFSDGEKQIEVRVSDGGAVYGPV